MNRARRSGGVSSAASSSGPKTRHSSGDIGPEPFPPPGRSVTAASGGELAAKKHPRARPIALYRSHGYAEHLRDLVLRESAEKAQLHHAGQPRFRAERARARSMRMWRIATAAMARKCARSLG